MVHLHLDKTQTDRLSSMLNVFDEVDREILFKIFCSQQPVERRVFRSADEADRAKVQRRADWERAILSTI